MIFKNSNERPNPMSMKPINITITNQMFNLLHKMQEDTGLTMSDLVRRSLEQYLKIQNTPDEVQGETLLMEGNDQSIKSTVETTSA